jgi:hypothetical protein
VVLVLQHHQQQRERRIEQCSQSECQGHGQDKGREWVLAIVCCLLMGYWLCLLSIDWLLAIAYCLLAIGLLSVVCCLLDIEARVEFFFGHTLVAAACCAPQHSLRVVIEIPNMPIGNRHKLLAYLIAPHKGNNTRSAPAAGGVPCCGGSGVFGCGCPAALLRATPTSAASACRTPGPLRPPSGLSFSLSCTRSCARVPWAPRTSTAPFNKRGGGGHFLSS